MADKNPSGLGVFDLALRFAGQRYDLETGLHYNYFRDFDPSLGTYKQSDPIGLKGGINTYAYVGGNPIRRRDFLGLDWQEDLERAFDHPMDQPYPSDYPRIERRPLWLPPPPPNPSEPGDRWPQDDDYRGQCRRLFETCVEFKWTGKCDDCLHYCTTQGYWPLDRCHPRRDNRRRRNSC
jgi:RHS repeat-associated protein